MCVELALSFVKSAKRRGRVLWPKVTKARLSSAEAMTHASQDPTKKGWARIQGGRKNTGEQSMSSDRPLAKRHIPLV